MKKLTLTALALLAAFSGSTRAAEELRFGVDPTFAPFESIPAKFIAICVPGLPRDGTIPHAG